MSRFVVCGDAPLPARIAFTRNEIPPLPCNGGWVTSAVKEIRDQPDSGFSPIRGRMSDWRSANPVRLSVSGQLGGDIDGAWWPRVDRMTVELPGLVAAVKPMVGDVTSINVNWPHLQRPPDFNWPGWEYKHQHVITLNGKEARVNLLVVAYTTYSALALMVLRRAADLSIAPADREKPAFVTAGTILQVALKQRAAETQVPQKVR